MRPDEDIDWYGLFLWVTFAFVGFPGLIVLSLTFWGALWQLTTGQPLPNSLQGLELIKR